MNKHMLYLAGLLNEGEFDRNVDLPDYGGGTSGMMQRYAYNFGVLQSTTKMVKDILESALRQLQNPEWNREEDSGLMLKHLEEEVRKALEKIESSQRYLHPDS